MPNTDWVDDLHYTAPTALTPAAGAITVTQAQHLVDAGTISSINKGPANVLAVSGDEVVLRPNGAVAVVIQGAGGNILTPLAYEVAMAVAADFALFKFNGASWVLVGQRVGTLTGSLLTIAAGAVGVAGQVRGRHTIDTSGPAVEDLNTINGGVLGKKIRVSSVNAARDVVLTNAGNIRTSYRQNIVLGDPSDWVDLEFDGTNWNVVGAQLLADVSIALTVAAGVITVSRSTHTVLGEGAAADLLDTINGGQVGQLVLLRAGTDRITVTGVGNVRTPGGRTISLLNAADYIKLQFSANATWQVLGWSATTDANPRMAAASVTDSTAVVNPAATTAFDRTGTVVANTPIVGTRVRITGKISKTAQGGADVSTYGVRIGASVLGTHAQTAAATALIIFEAEVVFRVVGAGGTMEGWIRFTQQPLAGGAVVATTMVPVNALALDTTADRLVEATVIRSVNDAGNSSALNNINVDIS